MSFNMVKLNESLSTVVLKFRENQITFMVKSYKSLNTLMEGAQWLIGRVLD